MARAGLTPGDKPALVWLGIISTLSHLPWVLLLRDFTSGDWWYIGQQRYHDFAQFSPIWVTDGLGNTSAVPHFYVIRFLEGIFSYLGATFALNEKIFFLLPMAFGATFGAYLLLRRYFTTWPAFIGAIVYAFNTAVLFNHVGPLTIGVAYALAPWCIYFFKRYLEEHTGRLLVLTALIFGVTALYELRIALIIIAVCLGLFCFNALIGEGKGYARKRLRSLAILLGIVLLLHAFWVVPYVISSRSVTFSDLLSRGLFVSFSDIQNALTLHHPFWTGSRPATFIVQQIPLYAWIIPVAAFGGFVLRGKQATKEIYYWGIVAAAGLFLVKQVNEPFVSVYPWLFGHVPGFGAYRESSKFYLLVALAYSVLIPFTLTALRDLLADKLGNKRWGLTPARAIYGSVSVIITGIFLINIWPLITGSFRTLYTARDKPADYALLEKFINQQPGQFRTLWVPVNSRWGVATNSHPALLATSLNQGDWLGGIGAGDQTTYATLRDKAVKLLQDPSSNDALDRAGVKYVIVPIRDTVSEDDFFRYYGDDRQYYINQLDQLPYLQRINIGAKDLVVYQNKQYQPYIGAFTNLQTFGLDQHATIDTFHQFITEQVKQPFNFVDTAKKDAQQPQYPSWAITNVFQEVTSHDITKDTVTKRVNPQTKPVLYSSPNNRHVRYAIQNNTLTFYSRDQNDLSVNGEFIQRASGIETAIGRASLVADTSYYLSQDDKPLKLPNSTGGRDLGVLDAPVDVYAAKGANILPDPSFEQGAWQQQVMDCNAYDKLPILSMKLKGGDATNGGRSLQFDADRHTACTQSDTLPATAKAYLLNFDYKVAGGRTAGYEVIFDGATDQRKATLREDLQVDDAKWHHLQKVITVPLGTRTVRLRLMGYPDYRLQLHATTNYDNTQLIPLEKLLEVGNTAQEKFTQTPLQANVPLKFSYPNRPREANNRIGNGSFESGLWQKKVADCNDYDDKPLIHMQQVRHNGGQALELGAQRHDACTSNSRTSVHENTNYMFSFDYQSPNATEASYFIRFDDPAQTTIQESLAIKDNRWHTYTRQIKAPLGATRLNIVVYARAAENGSSTILNRYDNFSLREIPDLPDRYFLVDEGSTRPARPYKLSSHYTNAVTKTVQVSSATAPFYLHMNEAYHPLWTLRLGTTSASDRLTRTPLNHQGFLPASDHFRLNDFENGWYVDPATICKNNPPGCTLNADGSYDLQLVIEFTPQRWLYTGSIVSLVTLAGCLGYLTYYRHRKAKQEHGWRWQ